MCTTLSICKGHGRSCGEGGSEGDFPVKPSCRHRPDSIIVTWLRNDFPLKVEIIYEDGGANEQGAIVG